jgi:hypothetical protein
MFHLSIPLGAIRQVKYGGQHRAFAEGQPNFFRRKIVEDKVPAPGWMVV